MGSDDTLFTNLYWRRNNCNLFKIANSDANKPDFLSREIYVRPAFRDFLNEYEK